MVNKMIYTLTLNPAIDRTITADQINYKDVTRVTSTRRDPAGKGVNVSKVIKSLSMQSVCLGFVAGNNGVYIKDQLDLMEIKHDFITVFGETRENIKLIEKETNNVLEINETGPTITNREIQFLHDKLEILLKKDDVLVVSGSVPNGVSKELYSDIIKEYKRLGVKVILDASGELFKSTIGALPNIIKPNKYELETYLDKTLDNDTDIKEAALELVKSGIEQVIVSLGQDGAMYVDKDTQFKVVVPKLIVKSSVGAGDSFVAGLCVALSKFDSVQEQIVFAASVGSASCLAEGTNPGSIEDVEKIREQIKIERI